jgi:hypothetical protein
MRRVILGLLLVLTACHESELEPQTPDQMWDEHPDQVQGGPLEASYAMAPIPAVMDPAPIRERPRSISLGYVGDAPLTETPPGPPRWPWVEEPFRYQEPYGPQRYGYGHRMRVPRYATR